MKMQKSPLNDWHASNQGKLVDFAGWTMPIQYESIIAEHEATRNRAALFDVSHMGRLRFTGERAAKFLDYLLTRRVTTLQPGQIRYGLMVNEQGGILDDVLVYCLNREGVPCYWLVVNAGNRSKILDWIRPHLEQSEGVTMHDETFSTAMIAIQGPLAISIAEQVFETSISTMAYYTGSTIQSLGERSIISRTGYTGEDGCEVTVPADMAIELWSRLLETGQSQQIAAAGLGARDTLRLEAAMPLYGNELTESIHPFEAGLNFAVQLKDREFIGSGALRELKQQEPTSVRVGLQMVGRRVPREHYPVMASGEKIGEVTSGTFSPTLKVPIAMAYVNPSHAVTGIELDIDIRGKECPATVVPLPFYKREENAA